MTDNRVMIRIRLTPEEVQSFERIRRFMRTTSLSQTVARMAVWNAETLCRDLDACGSEDPVAQSYALAQGIRRIVEG